MKEVELELELMLWHEVCGIVVKVQHSNHVVKFRKTPVKFSFKGGTGFDVHCFPDIHPSLAPLICGPLHFLTDEAGSNTAGTRQQEDLDDAP